MASKNLLPVVALCGALATGTPVAAWATPVMADSLPVALSSAPNPSSAIACERFSIAQAVISTSGCLRRNTDGSIVVDIKRSNKANGSQAGCAVCTWRSVVLDADGDPCNLELRIDIASVDDSANGAKVAFDGAFFEKGGGICLGCAAANADDAQPTLSFTASLRLTKAGTDVIAAGEASLLFYAVSTKDTDAHFEKPAGSLSLTRGIEAGPIEIDAHAQSRQRILADPALLEMEWNGSGAIGILPSAFDAKTLPQTTNPSTQPYKKRARTKKQVRATRRRRQTTSQLLSKRRMSPLPIQTIPSSRTVWGLLILKRSMKVTAACLPRSTTQRSSTLRTSKLPPPISPSASRLSSHFLNPSKSSFCHRARSWPQHCSPCWAPRILETKLKRSQLSTLQPPPSCVYTPLLQTEARPWNSMATHSWPGDVWTLCKTSRIRSNSKGLIVPAMPISSPRLLNPHSGL